MIHCQQEAKNKGKDKMTQRFNRMWSLLIGVLLLTVAAGFTWAQSGGGTLTITVQDTSGAVVPATKLVLKDIATNDLRQADTLGTGNYSFVGLNAGTYNLIVSKAGYKDEVFDAIVIHVARVTDITAKLSVGAVTDKVEVTAVQSPLVESTSNVIGATIDIKEIEFLPMGGRDPTGFAYLMPGVSGGIFSNQQGQGQVAAIDGVLATSSRGKGGSNGAVGVGAANIESAASPRLQNVEEMTVQTSNLDASQGYGQAAMQANITTRRGTNAYHGRLFVDLQNSSLDSNAWSRDFYKESKALYHKEDYGGTVSGPAWKDKLFFFGSYEQDYKPGKTPMTALVMTPNLQAGNYTYEGTDGSTQVANAFTLAKNGGLALSTQDSYVSGTELAAINKSLKYGTLESYGDSYETKNVNTLNFLEPNNLDYYYPTFRIDYNVKQNLRVNFAFNENKFSAPTAFKPVFPGPDFSFGLDSQKSTSYTAGIGVDWTISPTLVNQFKGGYLYNYNIDAPNSAKTQPWLTHNIVWWNGLLNAYSGDMFPTPSSNFYPLVSFSDNLVWQHKAHTITVGGSFYREQDHYWNNTTGYQGYNTGIQSGDPANNVYVSTNSALKLANSDQTSELGSYYGILAGDTWNSYISKPLDMKTHAYDEQYGARNLDELQKGWGLFAQDSWRVQSNLTVNLGLRWDFTGDDHDLNASYFSPTNAGLWGPSGVGNAFKPGTLGGDADPAYYGRTHAYKPWNVSPQPNVGFAWTPTVSEGFLGKLVGGNDTVIRGGYSLRRYTPQLVDYWMYASNYGAFFSQNYSLYSADVTSPGYFTGGTWRLQNAVKGSLPTGASWFYTPPSYGASITEASVASQVSLMGMQSDIAQPYIQSWNFGIQRKLGQNNAFELRYVGNHGLHQWMPVNLNETNIFENGFLQDFKNAQKNLTASGGTTFKGPNKTPILDQAFSNDPTGNYSNGTFIWNLQHGQVGSMVGEIATANGIDGNYLCNLIPKTFAPCGNGAILGYTGTGGTYPINFFQVNPYSAGGSVPLMSAVGYSNYNSMQAEFRQQAWHGMSFTINYTWNRSFGMSNMYTMRNPRLSYGPNASDVHHVINGYGTYDLPFGKGKQFLSGNGLLDRAVGGWIIGTVTTFSTGAPFQLSGGNNTYNGQFDGGINLTGVTNKQLQHAIGMRKIPGQSNYNRYWIDPKYISKTSGSVGQANPTYLTPNSDPGSVGKRYWLWGVKNWNSDMSLSKSVTIKNQMKFNLQGEFLDVFNHPSWSIGDTGLQSTTFGQNNGGAGSQEGNYGRIVEIRANFEF
jgi:hypothetical protein